MILVYLLTYRHDFQSIESTTVPVQSANVVRVGEWATFLDSLIQLNLLARDHNCMSILKYIDKIIIDVEEHSKFATRNIEHSTCFSAQLNKYDGFTR